jgi:LysM repeat protein/mono/diheme cytochrome c family protein
LNTQKQIAVIVVLFFAMVAGCAAYTTIDLPFRAVDQDEWHFDESVERGALLFANNCRTCHGIKGQGGVGLPLNVEKFQDQDPLVLSRNRALLQRTISCGRAGTLMPSWLKTVGGSLNDRQIEHIIDLITAPVSEDERGEDGLANNKGWLEAVEFAHNLNRDTAVVVGGDTLDTIAKAHAVGVPELVAANGGIDPDARLEEGITVNLPPTSTHPEGRGHEVRTANETLRKLADSTHAGAAILAELNGIPYKLNEDLGVWTMTLGDSEKSRAVGLIPGATLALPEGATWVIRSGDTIASIAALHNISEDEFTALNEAVASGGPEDEIPFERRLALPEGAVAIVQAGQNLAAIASLHGVLPADLAALNSIGDVTQELAPGDPINLPDAPEYVIQTGDTLASVAASHATADGAPLTRDDLAAANGLQPEATISPDVVVRLPKIDAYVVQGQSLEDIAKTFSNVTAASLAEAQDPPVEPETVFPVGAQLILPADAWGSTPPDTINQGTACLQYTVQQSTYEAIIGGGPIGGKEFQGTVEALNTQFLQTSITLPPKTEVTIVFDNQDSGIQHNIQFFEGSTPGQGDFLTGCSDGCDPATGDQVRTEVAAGPIQHTFTFTTPDVGDYSYNCVIHPNMKGKLTIEEGAVVPGG